MTPVESYGILKPKFQLHSMRPGTESCREEAGATMNDLVKVVVYLTRPEDRHKVENRIEDYYRRHAPALVEEPPAETLVCVPGLHEANLLVEIDSIAVLANESPGSSFR